MHIIAIANQKGGVGKTTTAINLGAYLAKFGRKVLIIDLDPQSNTTSGLGFDRKSIRNCLYDVLIDERHISEIIVPTTQKNLQLAPASAVLAAAEVELVSVLARESRLRSAISKLDGGYHFILIDCPPSLGLLTVNGLVAANKVLIPVQSEYYALEGLGQLLHTIERVKNSLNPNLDILGLALTMFDNRTILSRQVVKEIEKHFPDKVFKTLIPRNIRLAEAPSYGRSILQYDSWSKGAWAYKNLAKEVIRRAK